MLNCYQNLQYTETCLTEILNTIVYFNTKSNSDSEGPKLKDILSENTALIASTIEEVLAKNNQQVHSINLDVRGIFNAVGFYAVNPDGTVSLPPETNTVLETIEADKHKIYTYITEVTLKINEEPMVWNVDAGQVESDLACITQMLRSTRGVKEWFVKRGMVIN